MEVFRISDEKYASQLSASGRAARWNRNNEYVLYTASSRSLATLELTVHRSGIMLAGIRYKMMIISIPDDEDLLTIVPKKILPESWKLTESYTLLQKIGSEWYSKNESLVLKVPSAIIPEEYNYIINSKHPDINKIKIVRTNPYNWDERLL